MGLEPDPVWAGQWVLGRNHTWVPLTQYHAPVTGLVDQISNDRSTSALRVTGWLNVTIGPRR